MAWLEKRKRWRIRDWVDGKKKTVVKDAGEWKAIAEERLTEYRKTKGAGGSPSAIWTKCLEIPEACDLFFLHHGPGLELTSQYDLKCRLGRLKRKWKDKRLDQVNLYDVRDLLATLQSTGNRMKYLRVITTMYRSFAKWNKLKNILHYQVRLPAENPATEWRKEMKPSEKKELPRNRVLSEAEWLRFAPHLSKRARAICELALRRFLRTCDIRKLSHLNISGDMIQGLQAKTGEPFIIPVLENQPTRYDFTNFRKDWLKAQVMAGMNYPVEHPLHFNVRDLRRTGATWAYKRTKDLVGISRMLGHTNTETTLRYLNIDEADRMAIAHAVDGMARPLQKETRPLRGGAPVGQNLIGGDK